MNKKYEFTGETKLWLGRTLHQIRALIRIEKYDITPGDVGGWIEKRENLAHDGDAWVYGNARVFGDAWVYGNARVFGDAQVCDNARVFGNAQVCGDAWVYGNARVFGDAQVFGNAWVCGDAWVCDNARVCGDAWVYGNAHWLCIGPIGSRDAFTTFFRTKNKEIFVSCGCFIGNIEQFVAKVRLTHGDSDHAKAYILAAELAKTRIDLSGDIPEQDK